MCILYCLVSLNSVLFKPCLFQNDLIDEYAQFGEIYEVNTNIIDYISLINAMKSFISMFRDLKDDHIYKVNNPIFRFKLRLLLKSKKECTMYSVTNV